MNRRTFVSTLALVVMAALSGCGSSASKQARGSSARGSLAESPEEHEAFVDASKGKPFSSADRLRGLSEVQRNSLIMMNHLVVLMSQVNVSKNNKLLLDQIYSELYNNIAPDAVDEETLDEIIYLTGAIDELRLTGLKRERLRMIFERAQAAAAKETIPDPVALLSAASSGSLGMFAISVVYMAVDAASSYSSAMDTAESEFVEGGWELDDEETKLLHDNRASLFAYIVTVVERYGLPGSMALTEKSASQFADWEKKDVAQRIRFFEKEADTYCALGSYWLMLAQSYFEHGDYSSCIKAIETYESFSTGIFRDDTSYAKSLALGISAAEELGGGSYLVCAERWIPEILENCDSADWALRYFAAQSYLSLARETGDARYIACAYETALDSINELAGAQRDLNAAYIAPLLLEDGAENFPWSSEEAKEKHRYNKLLEAERKVELAPLYQPLLLNLELVYAMVQSRPDAIGETRVCDFLVDPPFLIDPLNRRYGLTDADELDISGISYDCSEIRIPALLLASNSTITADIKSVSDVTSVKDWSIDRVEREDETDPSSFVAIFKSKDAERVNYSEGSIVSLRIDPISELDMEPISVKFTAVGTKNKPWEHLAVWDDGLRFERR